MPNMIIRVYLAEYYSKGKVDFFYIGANKLSILVHLYCRYVKQTSSHSVGILS